MPELSSRITSRTNAGAAMFLPNAGSGGPEMEIAEAMRGTLAEVVGQAGMDLTRSADWTAEDWAAVAEQARVLKEQAGGRASAAGRVAAAAVAEHAVALEGAPQTVSAGMELAWPQSVDDVARSMGYPDRPSLKAIRQRPHHPYRERRNASVFRRLY